MLAVDLLSRGSWLMSAPPLRDLPAFLQLDSQNFWNSKHFFSDPLAYALPSVLAIYYFVVWLALGRDPKVGTVSVQYEVPDGISAAEARYALQSRFDGKTVAAVITAMAVKKYIQLIPAHSGYDAVREDDKLGKGALPEEARTWEVLFPRDAANPSGKVRHIAHNDAPLMTQLVSQIAGVLSPALQDKYFNRHLAWSGTATACSLLYCAIYANAIPRADVTFLTFWVYVISLVVGSMIVVNIVPRTVDLLRGEREHPLRDVFGLLLTVFIMLAIPLLVLWKLGVMSNFALAEIILLSLLLNIVGGMLLKAPTADGLELKRKLMGYRQFLESVERDRLNRLNDPASAPALLDQHLPYAIALDVRDAWSNRLEDTFDAVTTNL